MRALEGEISRLRGVAGDVVGDVVGELITARALVNMLTSDLLESSERDANDRGTVCMVAVEILDNAQATLVAVACGGTPAAA